MGPGATKHDTVFFPAQIGYVRRVRIFNLNSDEWDGTNGAHQISNRTDSPVRVLMLSSMIPGEIIEYLDTGKLLVKDAQDEDVMFARPGPTAEYWEGED